MLFLTLNTFSATGGVEKVCRLAGKVMEEITVESKKELSIFSLHDKEEVDTKPYLKKCSFKAFSGNRFLFVIKSFLVGIKSKVVVISHINLSLPAYLIKIFSPQTKVILLAHGIEVWKPLSGIKRKLIRSADMVVVVSNFTKKKILQHHPVKKILVINNCLDPYLPDPVDSRIEMRKKIGISEGALVLMTLSRLSSSEQNKNYDNILASVRKLKQEVPSIKYMFVGKYDSKEKERLDQLIFDLGLKDDVIFTGFVPDEELAHYYGMADIYVMPSRKEGFGISFIEAMYYGLPVIGGNADGSTDALLNGQLGLMVDPGRPDELTSAIAKVSCNIDSFKPNRSLLLRHFGFDRYTEQWRKALEEVSN